MSFVDCSLSKYRQRRRFILGMLKMRSVSNVSVRKLQGKRPTERPKHKQEDNTEMYITFLRTRCNGGILWWCMWSSVTTDICLKFKYALILSPLHSKCFSFLFVPMVKT